MLQSYDSCIKCSLCVAACPVYEVDRTFAGPKALGPDWIRIYESGERVTDPTVEACTFCQLCEAACPVGVPVAHLIAKHKEAKTRSLAVRIRDYGLTHPDWLARLPEVTLLPKVLAKAALISTKPRWPRPDRSRWTANGAGNSVGVWVDCYTRGFDGHVLAATLGLLDAWGFSGIPLPKRSACCGAAAMASGRLHGAKQAESSARSELPEISKKLAVLVTLNATCDATLRSEWQPPLEFEIVPFVEFALAAAGDDFFDLLATARGEANVYAHATCRSQVARGPGAMAELCKRSGIEAIPLDASCCGAAGSYAFKREHEKISRTLGSLATATIAGSSSSTVLVDSGPCALHLADLSGARVLHPAVWLYQRFNEAGGVGVDNP